MHYAPRLIACDGDHAMRWVTLCLLVGCVPPPVYRVQRTARVPRPAAPLRTGEALAGPVELSFGASSIGDVRSPRLVDDEASLEVADQQYRGEARFRLGRAELAPIFEYAGGNSMRALDRTQAPVGEGSVNGLGGAVRYSIDASEGFSFGIGLEAMNWEIPYVEYRTCVEYCEENNAPQMQVRHGVENVASWAFSFTPTYRRGPIAIFAGAYMRQHPTIERKGTELFQEERDEDVAVGPNNWLLHAGVEWRLPYVSVLAQVQQTITRDPIWYGPSFGFAIAARLPEFSLPKSTPPTGDGPAQPW